MPQVLPPPPRYRGTPHRYLLPAGSTLWRVHRTRYRAADFNSRITDSVFGTGRFDSTEFDPFAYLYAALDDSTALAETLLRDAPYDHRGIRTLPRKIVKDRVISAIRTHAPLYLIDLRDGPALAAVAQNSGLLHVDGDQYAQTRAVCRWLRDQAPWAQGLFWLSSRDHGKPTLILFEDRRAGDALEPKPERQFPLDDLAGAQWLNTTLAPLRTCVRPPR